MYLSLCSTFEVIEEGAKKIIKEKIERAQSCYTI